MQGGEIGVASESGKGSTFQFYIKTRRTNPPSPSSLPEARKPDFQLLVREDALREACGVEFPALQNEGTILAANIVSESESETEVVRERAEKKAEDNAEGTAEGESPRRIHILVVEDNLVNQKVVSKQLRKEGHVVSVANHGEEALDFIRKSKFWHTISTGEDGEGKKGVSLSVVLMDLEMPVMDGITCVRTIRDLQGRGKITGHVPVIAVTANARKDQILRSLEAGM